MAIGNSRTGFTPAVELEAYKEPFVALRRFREGISEWFVFFSPPSIDNQIASPDQKNRLSNRAPCSDPKQEITPR